MEKMLLWFYCLSPGQLVFLGEVFLVGFYGAKARWGQTLGWRWGMAVLLLLCLGLILCATLRGRAADQMPQWLALPLHSYWTVLRGGDPELLRSNFMNLVLFVPAGLTALGVLPEAWSGKRRILMVCGVLLLVSLGIEICQYHYGLGQADVDDVIHNALGAWLGAVAAKARPFAD